MPGSSQQKILNYNAKDLYKLVLDIEKYPDFLPWCMDSRIISDNKSKIIADLVIQYKYFNGTFRSFVNYNNKDLTISIKYTEGPLKTLYTNWAFIKLKKYQTLIKFDVELRFKFIPFNKLLDRFYESIEDKIIINFEKRAAKILKK
tara:strand:- start:257 stop:694 length:438 start_codon:yes stop_codon:yes gene_type:complete